MTALHQFGAEMLKLSRGLESFAPVNESADDRKGENTRADEQLPRRHKASSEW